MHGFVTTVVIIGMLIALIGVVLPLGMFGGRRLIAFGVLIVLGTGGIWLSDALRSPEQVAADVKTTAHLEAIDAAGYDDVERNPENYIELAPSFTNEFGSARVSGTLTNRSKFSIQNVRIRCDQSGETGKRLDRESLTITQRVPAEGTVEFGPLDLGYQDPQTAAINCRAVDGDAVPILQN